MRLTRRGRELQSDFGNWQTTWGEINRYQRLTEDIVQPLDDAKPSLPVGMAPGRWGALAHSIREAAKHAENLRHGRQQLHRGRGVR